MCFALVYFYAFCFRKISAFLKCCNSNWEFQNLLLSCSLL